MPTQGHTKVCPWVGSSFGTNAETRGSSRKHWAYKTMPLSWDEKRARSNELTSCAANPDNSSQLKLRLSCQRPFLVAGLQACELLGHPHEFRHQRRNSSQLKLRLSCPGQFQEALGIQNDAPQLGRETCA